MKKYKAKTILIIRKCWRKIPFKDKGLIVIMIISILQCIHNLYTVEPINYYYMSVNIIIRTSVAGIFGYFLSANFLSGDEDRFEKNKENEVKLLEQLLKENGFENKIEVNSKILKDSKEQLICNKNLQNMIAIIICVIISMTLIIGVNFKLITDGSVATIVQFKDLISGSIGFLLGNPSDKGRNKNK